MQKEEIADHLLGRHFVIQLNEKKTPILLRAVTE